MVILGRLQVDQHQVVILGQLGGPAPGGDLGQLQVDQHQVVILGQLQVDQHQVVIWAGSGRTSYKRTSSARW